MDDPKVRLRLGRASETRPFSGLLIPSKSPFSFALVLTVFRFVLDDLHRELLSSARVAPLHN